MNRPRFLAAPASPALRPYIAMYHETVLEAGAINDMNVTPSGHAALVFTVNGRYDAAVGDASLERVPGAIVHGQFTSPARNRFSGGHRGFLVLLTPIGIFGLLGCPADELADSWAELPRVASRLTASLSRLEERLRDAPDFPARCALADEVLLRTLEHRPQRAHRLHLAQHAIAGIGRRAGAVGIGELARELAVTERTLRRCFREVIGIAPKTFAEIVRFNGVIVEIHRRGVCDWLDLVDRFGYADQSHLGREFRRFAGVSPTAYAPEARALDRDLHTPLSG